jgi:hypothetical protein
MRTLAPYTFILLHNNELPPEKKNGTFEREV